LIERSDFDTTSAVLKELENQLPDGTSIAELFLRQDDSDC
jgi:hypothetical protein